MKKPFYLLALLLTLFYFCDPVMGQLHDTVVKNSNYTYISICALTGTSFLFSNNENGVLSISFPYSVTNANGTKSDSLFTSKGIQPYKKLKVFVSPIYLEIGSRKSFYTAQFIVSIIGAAAGYNYTLGYGRNFYLSRHAARVKNITGYPFVFKPFIRVSFSGYRGFDAASPFSFGTIDNENKTVSLLGTVAAPTYTTTGRVPQTYNAKTLDIMYAQQEQAIIPGISVSSNPYRHYFYWEIEAGYNIVLHEKGGIILTQNDKNTIVKSGLGDSRLKVSYNNSPIKSTPYIINGLYIGLKAGVSVRSKSFRNH